MELALALDELSKRPRSASRDVIGRVDTAIGHARFDLTVMLQAHRARERAEKVQEQPKLISVADLAERLTQ